MFIIIDILSIAPILIIFQLSFATMRVKHDLQCLKRGFNTTKRREYLCMLVFKIINVFVITSIVVGSQYICHCYNGNFMFHFSGSC
jgi:hypothetical protein